MHYSAGRKKRNVLFFTTVLMSVPLVLCILNIDYEYYGTESVGEVHPDRRRAQNGCNKSAEEENAASEKWRDVRFSFYS